MAAVLGGPARSEGIEDLIEFGVIPPTRLESTSDENVSREALTSEPEQEEIAEPGSVIQPPPELHLRADRQTYDARRQLLIVEGNVSAVINGGVLQADRLEFDTTFNSLFARGSVRYRKGTQYFQASSLRFSLIQGSGSMQDVYGVLDLDTAAVDFNPLSSNQISPAPYATPARQIPIEDASQDRLLPVVESTGLGFPSAIDIELESSTANRISPQIDGAGFWDLEQPLSSDSWLVPDTTPIESKAGEGMACPPEIPAIPDWHPHPWAVTAWGGQMIDSNFGDTFLFNGRMRPEYLLGVSMQKRIWRAGPLQLELEADLFAHQAYEQQGGPFNQTVPNANTPAQTFGEGILGLGARLWVQPWLSFGFVEGISYNSAVSNYERTYRENYANLLNYLAFELEATVSPELSMVGRIHHRSGAFGTYSGVKEGSNAYLIGLRYRWGQDQPEPLSPEAPPPLGCPDSDREARIKPQRLSEQLEDITLGNPLRESAPKSAATDVKEVREQSDDWRLSPAEQEKRRSAAIAAIDQRISSIQLQQRLVIEQNRGVADNVRNSEVLSANRYGGVKPTQLNTRGKKKLITGTISRWRIQAAQVSFTPEGWTADRMNFTNDPFTPAQTRIDAEDVVATEEENGDILIKSQRNRLIVEERLPIPVSRTQRIQKQEEVENRWVLNIDNDDRSGFFVGRELKSITLSKNLTLDLQPQFLLQRAIDGSNNSYVAPGTSIDSGELTQDNAIGDLFGLEAELSGKLLGLNVDAEADISTFSPSNFMNGSRFWGNVNRFIQLPLLGKVETRFFGAYRYRTWNGSLGETDVYSAYGAFAEKKGDWRWGKLSNNYIWRFGLGNYQAESFTSTNLIDTTRANFYGSMNSSYPLWRGNPAEPTPEAAYRYSPVAIVPGLTLRTNVNTTIAAFGDGKSQSTFSITGGPTLTLGTFSKPFLDYTELSIAGGGTLKQGASPFEFDQSVDLATLGIGLTQQIAGPLLLSAGVGVNVDPSSEFYGNVINSNIELRWQRRSYDLGFYFNPYEGIGGFRFRLNDFNFTGTGLPFIPYTPRNLPNELETRPF
ncbi:LPS-assembly protein LptD [Synechococcus sp. MIT S9508]|nr:LPS-assembly protein LptD [Synechococcus sp. MIT S9508]